MPKRGFNSQIYKNPCIINKTKKSVNYYTIKYYTNNGSEIWNVSIGETNGGAYGIAIDSNDEFIYVTGRSQGDYYTIKYYTNNGSEIWNITDINGYRAWDIAIDSNDEFIYVT